MDNDNKIAGVCMALLCGMERDAACRVIEALNVFAEDRHTPLSEAQFYRDLAASIELPALVPWFDELEATVH